MSYSAMNPGCTARQMVIIWPVLLRTGRLVAENGTLTRKDFYELIGDQSFDKARQNYEQQKSGHWDHMQQLQQRHGRRSFPGARHTNRSGSQRNLTTVHAQKSITLIPDKCSGTSALSEKSTWNSVIWNKQPDTWFLFVQSGDRYVGELRAIAYHPNTKR